MTSQQARMQPSKAALELSPNAYLYAVQALDDSLCLQDGGVTSQQAGISPFKASMELPPRCTVVCCAFQPNTSLSAHDLPFHLTHGLPFKDALCLQDGGVTSQQAGISPSKASWNSLLKWGSRQLPFAKSEAAPEQVLFILAFL